MSLGEQIQNIGETVRGVDLTDAALIATLAVTAVTGFVKSYISLRREDFDDTILIQEQSHTDLL